MICFSKMGYSTNWNLGNIFLKRNMIVFDMDRKIMGFYNKNIEPNNHTNNKKKILLLVIIIIIAVLVIIGLVAFIIITFIYQKRPKKAYELDENYDYSTHNLNTEIIN